MKNLLQCHRDRHFIKYSETALVKHQTCDRTAPRSHLCSIKIDPLQSADKLAQETIKSTNNTLPS